MKGVKGMYSKIIQKSFKQFIQKKIWHVVAIYSKSWTTSSVTLVITNGGITECQLKGNSIAKTYSLSQRIHYLLITLSTYEICFLLTVAIVWSINWHVFLGPGIHMSITLLYTEKANWTSWERIPAWNRKHYQIETKIARFNFLPYNFATTSFSSTYQHWIQIVMPQLVKHQHDCPTQIISHPSLGLYPCFVAWYQPPKYV